MESMAGSSCNSSSLTYDGVDVMGERFAEEVIQVIDSHPGLLKISFLCHSFGGLVARYAIARLHKQHLITEVSEGNGECNDASGDQYLVEKFEGKIAGLVPVNFITFATPHLGSRWHKQVPVLCGFQAIEKVVALSSRFLGRTLTHLFLADSNNGKPPLLLQMVSDSEDLKFMSALQSFKRCVVYANSCFDHLVGWSTASLRHRNELPKLKKLSRDEKYPHIVNVEVAKTASARKGISTEAKVNQCTNIDMEEEMLKSLTKLSWERIDVNFSGSRRGFFAHSNIQVKNYFMNSDGADVVQHMIDRFLV